MNNHFSSRPTKTVFAEKLLSSTPSRILVGRSGTRYQTSTYLEMRADHAIAKDAVYSEVSEELIANFQMLTLKSFCLTREEFLLYPMRGRRVESDSLKKLEAQGTKGCDVQIIVGDGLSAWAIHENLAELLPCLENDISRAGFTLGRRIFVKFARVGVQDHIGVALAAKSTLILVGERPGLGTGDSLSIYLAYAPKIDQDNAEKNCISNIRKLGVLPHEASAAAVAILQRAFREGRGGLSGGRTGQGV